MLTNTIQVLDPTVNSAAFLLVLHARLESFANKTPLSSFPVPVDSELWNRLVQFLTKFDPVQVRYLGALWRNLLECFCVSALTSQTVRRTHTLALLVFTDKLAAWIRSRAAQDSHIAPRRGRQHLYNFSCVVLANGS